MRYKKIESCKQCIYLHLNGLGEWMCMYNSRMARLTKYPELPNNCELPTFPTLEAVKDYIYDLGDRRVTTAGIESVYSAIKSLLHEEG